MIMAIWIILQTLKIIEKSFSNIQLESLKATSNADENIQFILDLADRSMKAEALEKLIDGGKLVSSVMLETKPDNNTKIVDIGEAKGKLFDEEVKRIFKIPKKEIKDMPELIRKVFIANDYSLNRA